MDIPIRRVAWFAAVALGAFAGGVGCDESRPGSVRVLAASSLASTLESMAVAGPVEISGGASSVLALQIVAGARADVVVLADRRWMDELERAGRLVPGTRAEVARNRLVLAVPRGEELRFEGDIPRGRMAIAEPETVPLGRYAAEALRELGWWSGVERDLVVVGDARAVLGLVERGEVDCGIVYASDASRSESISVERTLDPALHRPIRCEAALLDDRPAARRWLQELQGPRGRSLVRTRGFLPAAPSTEGSVR
ncbi:MAG: molybdate ABC transporter substrate-binding protein [Planctomycetota bacterium]|nr:molybdate ABC transporter substrate-binding protein [Planctomycetota bacterium]